MPIEWLLAPHNAVRDHTGCDKFRFRSLRMADYRAMDHQPIASSLASSPSRMFGRYEAFKVRKSVQSTSSIVERKKFTLGIRSVSVAQARLPNFEQLPQFRFQSECRRATRSLAHWDADRSRKTTPCKRSSSYDHPKPSLTARPRDTSVQTLNEFAVVARHKLGMTWQETNAALAAIRTLCGVVHPLDVETHRHALRLAECHAFSLYDALIVAAALRAGCAVLHSQDMQHDMEIEQRLRICNPFL